MPKADYERVLCTMSVSLDTVPFGGGVTLWDSLHCGVSFVTAPNLQVSFPFYVLSHVALRYV